jgi:hypothetical protein
MHTLHRFLVDYNMTMLRVLALGRGVALDTNRQTEAADQLGSDLLDPVSVRIALARLSTPGREALDTLVAHGGRMRAPHFFRRFGKVRPVGPGRLEREAVWQEPENPAEELLYLGLMFRAFEQDRRESCEFVFVPDDLRGLLPDPQVESPLFRVETAASVPSQGNEGQDLVHDLFAYLSHLQNHDVRPYADGRLGKHDLAAIRGRLYDPDERRLGFLRHLAQRLELVGRHEEHLRLESAPVKRWLTSPYAQQLAELQGAWRDDATWSDLFEVPGLTCEREESWLPRYDPTAARQRILEHLARCPLDSSWTLASFVTAVKEADPDFQRPDGDYASWYIRDADHGVYLSGFDSWDRVEGALIADLLTGPLRWLGVVAVAESEDGYRCRVTGAGARFLGLLPGEPDALPSPSIVVHGDFRIEVPPPVNLYTRFQLQRFAKLESADPCRYRLTAGSLGRALSRGVLVDQILAFLQQASTRPVPPRVAGQVRLWAGRFGQASIDEVALLRVRDERSLKELKGLPETRSLIGTPLTPTSALVQKRNLPRLRRELRALGYLPPSEAEVAGDPKEDG